MIFFDLLEFNLRNLFILSNFLYIEIKDIFSHSNLVFENQMDKGRFHLYGKSKSMGKLGTCKASMKAYLFESKHQPFQILRIIHIAGPYLTKTAQNNDSTFKLNHRLESSTKICCLQLDYRS